MEEREERWEIIAARYDCEGNICATYESSVTGEWRDAWYMASSLTLPPALAVELAEEDAEAYSSAN
jgi:hypothetical protein